MRYHPSEIENYAAAGPSLPATRRTCLSGCQALAFAGSSAHCESCGRRLSPEEACRALCGRALATGTVTRDELLSFLEARLLPASSDQGRPR